jgi:hypothetical protein
MNMPSPSVFSYYIRRRKTTAVTTPEGISGNTCGAGIVPDQTGNGEMFTSSGCPPEHLRLNLYWLLPKAPFTLRQCFGRLSRALRENGMVFVIINFFRSC